MEMVHEKKKHYTCNVCDAEFYFNHQYEQHVKGMLQLKTKDVSIFFFSGIHTFFLSKNFQKENKN